MVLSGIPSLVLVGVLSVASAYNARPIFKRVHRSYRHDGAVASATVTVDKCSGYTVLRPWGEPRALVHFCGGVFVSPAPQLAYRYVLESLARRGYAVVATSYAVDFDYNKPAAEILKTFSAAKAELGEYAELPQVAVGHSLGALMQVLLCATEPAYAADCAGAVLVSYNNKPVQGAVPLFEELFVPALAPYADIVRLPSFNGVLDQFKALRRTGFQLARDVASLSAADRVLDPDTARQLSDAEAIASLVDQVPQVLGSVAQGVSEFSPSPAEVQTLVGASFGVSSPLIISFSDDSLDESPVLERALPLSAAARSVRLRGTHLTPLALDPITAPAGIFVSELPGADEVRRALLADADALLDAIDDYVATTVATVAAAASMTGEASPEELPAPEEIEKEHGGQ